MEINVSNILEMQQQVTTQSITSTKDQTFDTILQQAMTQKDDDELKKACDELEGYMISMMFKQMKKSMLSGDSLIAKGDYEATFEDMHINNLSLEMVKAGGIGLSESMYRQMKNIYGAQMEISEK